MVALKKLQYQFGFLKILLLKLLYKYRLNQKSNKEKFKVARQFPKKTPSFCK
jgi:hypothetical protein